MTPLEVISLYPAHNHTLQSLFETRRQANPTKPFIVFKDKTWTWGEFADSIERTARVLAALKCGGPSRSRRCQTTGLPHRKAASAATTNAFCELA